MGLCLLWVSTTHASDNDAQARSEARTQYEAGARLYARGQYLDAVQAFERAYALSGAKPLLFNIAQAYRLVGHQHCQQALDAYQRYLAADPLASNHAEVEERITAMQACVEAQRRERAPLPQNSAAETKPPPRAQAVSAATPARVDQPSTLKPSRVLPLTLVVGGSLVALGGAALYALARVEYERAEGTCPCPEGKYARWERVTHASYGLLAVGGTSLAGGLVWLGALRTSRYSLGITPWRIRLTARF